LVSNRSFEENKVDIYHFSIRSATQIVQRRVLKKR